MERRVETGDRWQVGPQPMQGTNGLERRPVVERREVFELLQVLGGLLPEHQWSGELRAAMDDAVPGCVGLRRRLQELLQRHLKAACRGDRQIGGCHHLVTMI